MTYRPCLCLCGCFLFVMLFSPLYSEEGLTPPATTEMAFATVANSGLVYGFSREMVYSDSGAKTTSLLEWALKPLMTWGFGLEFTTKVGFYAKLHANVGVPGISGTMTDSDFLNDDNSLTHFSSHTCNTESANYLDFQTGWRFGIIEPLSLLFSLGFQYQGIKYTANDGYLQYPLGSSPYPDWSDTLTKQAVYGNGISFLQTMWFPYVGLDLRFSIGDQWAIFAGCKASAFVWATGEDNHYFRSLVFRDTMKNGWYLEPQIGARLRLSPTLGLGLTLNYRDIFGLLGDSESEIIGIDGTWINGLPTGSRSNDPLSAGANYQTIGATIALETWF